jgi:hypothetical protein
MTRLGHLFEGYVLTVTIFMLWRALVFHLTRGHIETRRYNAAVPIHDLPVFCTKLSQLNMTIIPQIKNSSIRILPFYSTGTQFASAFSESDCYFSNSMRDACRVPRGLNLSLDFIRLRSLDNDKLSTS